MPFLRRRDPSEGSDGLFQARERRCGRAGRREPPRLSWRRPDLSLNVDAAKEWRPHQSDDAKGDARILTAVSFATAPLELPQRYFLDQMVGAFLQDQAGAGKIGRAACREGVCQSVWI